MNSIIKSKIKVSWYLWMLWMLLCLLGMTLILRKIFLNLQNGIDFKGVFFLCLILGITTLLISVIDKMRVIQINTDKKDFVIYSMLRPFGKTYLFQDFKMKFEINERSSLGLNPSGYFVKKYDYGRTLKITSIFYEIYEEIFDFIQTPKKEVQLSLLKYLQLLFIGKYNN